jgi:hypothetical protein
MLAFLLPLDLELSVAEISGGGERLRAAAAMVDGEYQMSSNVDVGIKLSDLVSLGLLLFLLGRLALKSRGLPRRIDIRLYRYPLLFLISAMVVLVANQNLYTDSQLRIALAYLVRYAEISLAYVFFAYYLNSGGKRRLMFKALIVSAMAAAVIGIINPSTFIFSGWLITDRVEFYGVQMVICVFLVAILLSRASTVAVTGLKRQTLWLAAALLGISVLLCGKRTPMLGLLVALSYLFIMMLSERNFPRIAIMAGVLMAIGAASVVERIQLTLSGGDRPVWEGLSTRYADALYASGLGGLSGLDYSTAEHLGKALYSFSLVADYPFFGIGFWGAPYVYNFLPDGTTQVLIETGTIGSLLLALPVLIVWRETGRRVKRQDENRPYYIAWRAVVLAMVIMGFTANVAYSFKVVAVFLLFTAVVRNAARPLAPNARPSQVWTKPT